MTTGKSTGWGTQVPQSGTQIAMPATPLPSTPNFSTSGPGSTEPLRVIDLAARLGMTVVEGNPEDDILHHDMGAMVQRMLSAGIGRPSATRAQRHESRIRIAGTMRGLQTRITLHEWIEVSEGDFELNLVCWFEFMVRVMGTVPCANFELMRRPLPGETSPQQRMKLPMQNFGDEVLDARFDLRTLDPQLPARLATVVGALIPFPYTHLLGEGDSVALAVTQFSLRQVVDHIEPLTQAIAATVHVLEGRPITTM